MDGLPVLAASEDLAARPPLGETEVVVTRTQVAALALSGFAAGAATMAIANRRRIGKALVGAGKRKVLSPEVLSSRSFLVDVHLLRRD